MAKEKKRIFNHDKVPSPAKLKKRDIREKFKVTRMESSDKAQVIQKPNSNDDSDGSSGPVAEQRVIPTNEPPRRATKRKSGVPSEPADDRDVEPKPQNSRLSSEGGSAIEMSPVAAANGRTDTCVFHPTSEGTFVVLKDLTSINFGGSCLLVLVQGTVEVYGISIGAADDLPAPLESVPGSCIKVINRGHLSQSTNIRKLMDQIGAGNSIRKARELLSRFPRRTILFAYVGKSSFSTLKPNFSNADDLTMEHSWSTLGQYFIPTERALVEHNSKLENLAKSLSKPTSSKPVRALFVGPKDSGKSSLIKVICNQLLLARKRQEVKGKSDEAPILVLDLDPGQTMFTPPGCISLVQVNELLMGPSSSHQIRPELSYLVDGVTPGASPTRYIGAVEALMESVSQLQGNFILLVNTMGWISGIGSLLLGSVLQTVKPTTIFKTTTEVELPGIAWPNTILDEYKSTVAPSIQGIFSKDPFTKTVKSSLHREASIVGYFGGVPIFEKSPLVIPWNKVALHELSNQLDPKQFLYLMNANMVALCRVPDRVLLKNKANSAMPRLICPEKCTEEPIECLGFAIVRCVKMTDKSLFIVTPESSETLASANALVHNGVSLPYCFFKQFQDSPDALYLQKNVKERRRPIEA